MRENNKYRKITSSSNPVIKNIKSLYKKKARWNQKRFIIEGVKSVEELLKEGNLIDYIVYSDKLLIVNEGVDLLDKIDEKDIELVHVSDNLFKEITNVENPQGVMAIVKFNLVSFEDILKNKDFLIYLDEVADPGNMGTIIRTADAFGASGIIISEGSVDVYNPKVVRASMGSIFHVPLCYVDDEKEAFEAFKREKITILATALKSDKFIHEVELGENTVLIIGNEARGVSEASIDNADELVKIYMSGEAESLNAAIAASIVMYEVAINRINEACTLQG